MSETNSYVRTDLAAEATPSPSVKKLPGVDYQEETFDKMNVSRIKITSEEGSQAIGKPIGTYITVGFGKLWIEDDETLNKIQNFLANEIKNLADSLCPNFSSVLVVGIGNNKITADAIGPETAHKITVTRHIKSVDASLFLAIGQKEVSALFPGVIGETGIEALDQIKSAVEKVKPNLVIVVDALASRSIDRLATTVQITDTGISPGSGVGNSRSAINKETLGVPVIAIGVPTIVDSSTLVYDALEKAGIHEFSDSLKEVLDNGRSFFVSIKDSDVAVEALSDVISAALDDAFAVA